MNECKVGDQEMKLWYQSMTREDSWPQYQQALNAVVRRAKEPNTEIEVHGLTEFGGTAHQFRYAEYLELGEVFRNCERAMREGFDAFLVGNIGDPGLHVCREIANIPVLGLGETSMHLACMMGANFSLVPINEKFTLRLEENIHSYGLTDKLRGLSRMRMDRVTDFEKGFSDASARKRIIDEFLEAANRNVEGGAEVVIPAGGVPMVLLALDEVNEAARGTPILNGVTALIKTAEAVVRLNRLMGGRFTSKRLSYAAPTSEHIDDIRRAYGDVYPTVKGGSSSAHASGTKAA
jgi:allantoin racemase